MKAASCNLNNFLHVSKQMPCNLLVQLLAASPNSRVLTNLRLQNALRLRALVYPQMRV